MVTNEPRPGRRRDPQVDARIKAAALELYARLGWAGFTFEAVAREAQIGKPAIYLRWDSRGQLLFDALDLNVNPQFALQSGSLRSDLIEFGVVMHNWWRSRAGHAWLRLQLDQQDHEELAEFHIDVVRRNVDESRRIVDSACSRGELESFEDGVSLLEIVNGAVLNHIMMTRPERRSWLDVKVHDYVERIVNSVLTPSAGGSNQV